MDQIIQVLDVKGCDEETFGKMLDSLQNAKAQMSSINDVICRLNCGKLKTSDLNFDDYLNDINEPLKLNLNNRKFQME